MDYDVIVIGGGPGGYVSAIRSAQLGHKTAVIEKDSMGGICLNWGCIPTKALLKNAEVYKMILEADKFGIKVDNPSYDWKKIINRSRKIAKRLSKGIEYLMKKNNIQIISGHAYVEDKNTVLVDDKKKVTTKNIVIATGARPKQFSDIKFDGSKIINYKDAMTLPEIPDSISIIGAGAIGVEFAHFFNSFGAKVTLIEAVDRILPLEDSDVSNELKKIFLKRGIDIKTNAKVDDIITSKNVKIKLESGDDIDSSCVLIAIGVNGNTEGLFAPELDISLDRGFIEANKFMQTNTKNIYAIGDIAGPPWLAHVASKEGILAAEHISGKKVIPIDYSAIPACTYCSPEISSIGITEQYAKEKGYKVKIGKFPLSASGKAMAISKTEGFAKIIFDEKYGELLGFHMIGESATELVSEIAVAKRLEATYAEILDIIHPHPTISESILEATADSADEPIHI